MKSIQRTDKLGHAKLTTNGTRVLYESASGGMRKICCPKCGSANAVPGNAAGGKPVLVCPAGHQFTSTPM